MELFEFFEDRLVVTNAYDSNKPMLNRLFFYVPLNEIEEYRSSFPANDSRHIPGTLRIHEVVVSPAHEDFIMYRDSACVCNSCLQGLYSSCESLDAFKELPETICLKKHYFTKGKKKSDISDHMDLNEDELKEVEESEYMESEVAKVIKKEDMQ